MILSQQLKLFGRTESDNSSRAGELSKHQQAADLGRKGEDVRLMRERLDQTDTVRGMRETYDKWMDMVDGKLLFLNQQVKEGVASMSNPETASLQDIFKAMATKVRTIPAQETLPTLQPCNSTKWCFRRTSTGTPRLTLW